MTSSSIPQKRCTKCGQEFPATTEYFHRHKNKLDGLRPRCKQCRHEETLASYWAEPEKSRQKQREMYPRWREAHRAYCQKRQADPKYREYARKKSQAYYHAHRDDPAWRASHQKRNRKYDQAHTAKRRALKHNSTTSYTTKDVRVQIRSQTDSKGRLICWWCDKPIRGKFHVDHRIPLSRGGSNDARNICITHGRCNEHKHNKLPHEWNGRLL